MVEVSNGSTGEKFFFPHNAWIEKKAGEPHAEAVIKAGNPDAAATCRYRVAVHTSDIRGAGTVRPG